MMKSIRSIIKLSVVAIAATLMSGCGATLSASGSMPSDDLYSVNSRQAIAKRETEKAELAKQQALARKAQYEAAIAQAEAEDAARRLDEVNGVAGGAPQGEYERRLRGFDSPVYVVPQSYFTYSDLYWDLTYNWNWYWGWNTPFYYSSWRNPSFGWNMGWGWTSPHFGFNWGWNDPWYGWNNPWYGGGHHHHYPSWGPPSYNVNYRPNYGSSYNNGTTIAGRPSSWTDGNRTPSTGSYNNNNSYRRPNSSTNSGNKTNNSSRPSYNRPSREENNNNNNTYTRPSYNQPSYSSPSSGSWGGGSSSGGSSGGGGGSRPTNR